MLREVKWTAHALNCSRVTPHGLVLRIDFRVVYEPLKVTCDLCAWYTMFLRPYIRLWVYKKRNKGLFLFYKLVESENLLLYIVNS